MDGEHLPRDQEAKFTEFNSKVYWIQQRNALSLLWTYSQLSSEEWHRWWWQSHTSHEWTQPCLHGCYSTVYCQTQPTPALLGAPNSKQPWVGPSKPPKARVLAPSKTKNEVGQAWAGAILKTTCDDIMYCLRIWNEWRHHRQVNYGDSIPKYVGLTFLILHITWAASFWKSKRRMWWVSAEPPFPYCLWYTLLSMLQWKAISGTPQRPSFCWL